MRVARPANKSALWRFGYNTSSIFRSVGLELYNVLIRSKIHQTSAEPQKAVVERSRWLALSRCAVHIIPALFSIVLVTLNLKHYYIGRSLQGLITNDDTNLALLQGAAKIQELLITASTGTILFDIIRSELMYGDGVPLGLVGAGFSFTGLSFFWSPDFLCSLRYKARLWKKAFLFVSIFVAGALALTVGPATAVLVIPRDQLWQAGGSPFYLQGKEDDIWPTIVTYDTNRDPSFCLSSTSPGSPRNASEFAVCPSGGYKSLASHYSAVNVSSFLDTGTTLPYVADLSVSRYSYEIRSPRPGVPTQITLGNIRKEGGAGESFLAQPHAASIMFQEKLTVDWWNAAHHEASNSPRNPARYHLYTDLSSSIETQIPSVGVTCTVAHKVATDTIVEIEFPTIPFRNRMTRKTAAKVPKYDPKALPVRFAWTPLDGVKYPGVTTGATISYPGNDSALVVGCSVAAGWLKAKVAHGLPLYKFVPFDIDFGSTRTISVEDSWLNVLTPVLNASGPTGDVVVSSIESIIWQSGLEPDAPLTDVAGATKAWNTNTFTGGGNQTTFLESLVASVFADGLSRTGSHKAYADTSLPPEHWSLWSYNRANDYNSTLLAGGRALKPPSGEDFTELRVNMTIKGYSYMSSGVTDYLSMAVMLFHLLIALAHTIFCLYRGTSSGCWDTITELLTLAQNSQPSTVPLRNTAAGIKKGSTFSKKARIRTVGLKAGAQRGHVELVYEDDRDDILHGGPQDAEMVPLKLNEHQRTLSVPEVQEPHHDQGVEAGRSRERATSDVSALSDSDDDCGNRATGGMHEDGDSYKLMAAANDEASISTLRPMGSQQVRVRSRSSDTVQLLLDNVGRSSAVQATGLVQVDVKYA
ncbi:MAG: hypothetical protein Q9208_008160 [Pyrenodesmia sp. 3 TL-2023]